MVSILPTVSLFLVQCLLFRYEFYPILISYGIVQALFLTFFDGLSAIRQIQVLYN